MMEEDRHHPKDSSWSHQSNTTRIARPSSDTRKTTTNIEYKKGRGLGKYGLADLHLALRMYISINITHSGCGPLAFVVVHNLPSIHRIPKSAGVKFLVQHGEEEARKMAQ